MVTKDEALKLALEVLKLSAVTVDSFGVQKKVQQALAAIDEALAQPAQEPCTHRIADARNQYVKSGYFCLDCGALFSAADHFDPPAAQPAQQPQVRTGKCLLVGVCASEGHKIQAQRPWVSLTAQEAANCWTTSATQTWKNFEAKLKEKNN